MSELLITAAQNECNAERVRAWRLRYFRKFNAMPDGNLRQHRRLCIIQRTQKIFMEKMKR